MEPLDEVRVHTQEYRIRVLEDRVRELEEFVTEIQGGKKWVLTGLIGIPTVFAQNASYNIINNPVVVMPIGHTSRTAIILTSGSSVNQNSDFNYFVCSQVYLGDNSDTGIALALCDSNFFIDHTQVGLTAGLTPTCVNFNYTAGNPNWPSSNQFFGADWGFNITAGAGRLTNTGSPSGSVPNVINGFSAANAAAIPSLANLNIIGNESIFVSKEFGYASGSGAGNQVTQLTNINTAVTINNPCGQIITVSNTWTAGAAQIFFVNNSVVTSIDNIILSVVSPTSQAIAAVTAVGTGVFGIWLDPIVSATFAVTINFAVIKGAVT